MFWLQAALGNGNVWLLLGLFAVQQAFFAINQPTRTAMLVVAVFMLGVGGAADMASAAFRTSMLQSSASDEVRGRLQGIFIVVVAVPAQIYALTGSSAYVGLTGVFGLVPLVVFGLWGGALADHFDRRTLLMVTTTGLIATSAMFWLQAALGNGNVWLLLGLFAVQQAFFAINQPTRSAILPKLLPPEQLPAANSLNMTVMQAGGIAGPLVGGALIPVTGFSWLYLIDTITANPWRSTRETQPESTPPTTAPAGIAAKSSANARPPSEGPPKLSSAIWGKSARGIPNTIAMMSTRKDISSTGWPRR
jgi:MFS family permease